MSTFLEQLAGALWAEHGTALGRVAVVLPSQRAALYLREALARQAGRAIWSPELFTWGSFMERISGLRTVPTEELLFEAYEAYRTVVGTEARAFEEFISWAPITLADISEADAHLVALHGYYRDLRSWEELEWSFNTVPLSEGQQRMVRYWTLAGKLHLALNERLRNNLAGTTGGVARAAAEKDGGFADWERIWFAGLNAFTAAENRLVERAQEAGIARFAWDADRYYLDDPKQASGLYLRSAIQRFGPGAIPAVERTPGEDAHVRVVRVPNNIAQVWSASERIRALTPEERSRTAIVLADEQLLPAMLEAIPGDTDAVNITMGLSLAGLPVGSLIEAFLRAIRSVRADGSWTFVELERLLRHPFLRQGSGSSEATMEHLRATRMLLVPAARVIEALDKLDAEEKAHALVVFQRTGAANLHERLLALLSWARTNTMDDAVATEQIYQATIVLQRVDHLIVRYGHADDPLAWAAILLRLLKSARVGFFGEPLRGLQVMGLLEARALDYHRVIVLGAQEGTLPASTADRSYIPFELRRAYGLPLRESSDAVQAYNFMRLLNRASEVDLVYADDGTSNGPSRYIAQLAHERFKHQPGRMVFSSMQVPVPLRSANALAIPQTQASLAAIQGRLARGLSPTMLRTWLKCPLDFWFRYVQGLQEPEDPGARIAGNVLGDALHGVVEDIYRPWLGSPLNPASMREAAGMMHERLVSRLTGTVSSASMREGQPLLQVGMASRAARAFLQAEAMIVDRGTVITPLHLESALEAALPSASARHGNEVRIKGRLDRVDNRDGVVHILDLKTGKVDDRALRIPEISIEALRGDKGYAAQLLVYAWLWFSANPDTDALRVGLLPLQKGSASEGLYLNVDGKDRITRHMMPALTTVLETAIAAMLEPDRIFQHDPTSRYCPFCFTAGSA